MVPRTFLAMSASVRLLLIGLAATAALRVGHTRHRHAALPRLRVRADPACGFEVEKLSESDVLEMK